MGPTRTLSAMTLEEARTLPRGIALVVRRKLGDDVLVTRGTFQHVDRAGDRDVVVIKLDGELQYALYSPDVVHLDGIPDLF